MAYFAKLNSENVVTEVVVISDSDCMVDGKVSEEKGIDFCKSLFGKDTNWVQTFEDGKRLFYASVGFTYDKSVAPSGVFIPPQPYPSWVLTKDYEWVAPTPMPKNDLDYFWNEKLVEWSLYPEQYNEVPVILNELNIKNGGVVRFFPPFFKRSKITSWMWKQKGDPDGIPFENIDDKVTITGLSSPEEILIGCVCDGKELWSRNNVSVNPL